MTYPFSLPTAAVSLARCALLLALCSSCHDGRDAEIGIFDVRPELRNEHSGTGGATPASGGSGASSATLTVDLIASAKDFCPGETVDLLAAVSGGRPPYEYTWELDGAGSSGSGPQTVTVRLQTAATFLVTVTDADFQQSHLEVGDWVQVMWRADCAGLPAAGEPAPPLQPTPDPTPTAPTAPTNPTPTEPNTPAPANPPKPEALALTLQSSAASVCRGDCVELTASATGGRAPYQYNWELPDLSGPGPHRVCPTKTTTYAAFAMDADFESNHLEVGATTLVVVSADCTK